ncbi:MAG: hypothetical protein ACJAW7_003425, partial [Candidatus Azotimanducaceae bacterium]
AIPMSIKRLNEAWSAAIIVSLLDGIASGIDSA